MKPRWVWLVWVPAIVTALRLLLIWVDARRYPDHWDDSGAGLICFLAALEWIRAALGGVVYVLAMKGVVRLMHRFRVYRHRYLLLVSVGVAAAIGGLAGPRGALYGGAVGVVLAGVFIFAHRPQVAPVPFSFSLSDCARYVRCRVASRWVRVGVGFVLPLLLGALPLALIGGWRDGSWLDMWGNSLPPVLLFMGLPVLVYTVVMEVAGSSMHRAGRYRASQVVALSTLLGTLAGGVFGPMFLVGAPVGVVCGFVLVFLRV